MSDLELPAAPVAKPSLKQRLSAHFAEYGRIAVITYLVLSAAAIVGFSIAIGIGVEPSSASGFLGVVAAGWLAAKTTLPIRIGITLVVTPPFAALMKRRGRGRASSASESDEL
ncbi:MAG: hypothetical protein H6Q90_448 [Deltaproteobacteria bacterium]|nr:hypothetical protein [Deltaproteobacteria bacterium]